MVTTNTTKPYISAESVQRMMQHMINPGSNRSDFDALLGLICVRLHLLSGDLPDSENAYWIALQEVVCGIVINSLSAVLQDDFARLSQIQNKQEATQRISQLNLAQIERPFLVEWCLLYLCYVRVDVGFSLEYFAEAWRFTPRTARRHRVQAIDLLTTALTQEEERANKQYRVMMQISKLPFNDSRPFMGRSELLNVAVDLLHANPLAKLLVSGPPGIGKSHFTREICRHFVSISAIENVVWINADHASIDEIYHEIGSQLVPTESPEIDLKQLLMLRRTLIVIDQFERTLENTDLDTINEFLHQLGSAQVILISRKHVSLSNLSKTILVGTLDPLEIKALIRHYQPDLLEDECVEITQLSQGNPSVAILVSQNFLIHSMSGSLTSSLDQVLTDLYKALPPDAQILWNLLALMPPELSLAPAELAKLWNGAYSQTALQILVNYHIAVVHGDTVNLQSLCYIYTKGLYEKSDEILRAIEPVIDAAFASGVSTDVDILFGHLVNFWAENHWSRHLHNKYVDAFPKVQILVPESRKKYVPQYSSDSEENLSTLRKIIETLGVSGDFVGQANVQLHLAVVYKRQGQLDDALFVFDKVIASGKRYRDAQLVVKASIQKAKIMLEASELDEAHQILDNIADLCTEASVERHLITMYQFLMCEIWLLRGEIDHAQQHLVDVEIEFDDNYSRGLLYALRSRIYMSEKQYEHALEYLSLAGHIFQEINDLISWGRVLTNQVIIKHYLGMEQNGIKELQEIAELQSTLNDRIGVIYTQHNIDTLKLL